MDIENGPKGRWVRTGQKNQETNVPYLKWVPDTKESSTGTSYEEPPCDPSLLTPEEYVAQQKKIADKRAEDYQKSRPDIYD